MPGRPHCRDYFEFWHVGCYRNYPSKFYVNRLRGFGVLTPSVLPFSIGLAGRPYNSVSATVLHCDESCLFHINGSVSGKADYCQFLEITIDSEINWIERIHCMNV